MSALDQSIQNESRHAVFVNRFAGGLSNDFVPFLDELRSEAAARLAVARTDFTQKRLNELIKDIKAIQTEIYAAYEKQLFEQLELFSISESEFELKSLEDVNLSRAVSFTLPAPNQVISAFYSTPLVFPDSNNVVLLKPFIRDWAKSEVDRVSKIIRTGVAIGETTDQIARNISGKSGALTKQARRNNKAIVRTAVNHVSASARTMTMRANDDIVIGYEWVSTLDSRTTAECRSLDGRIFKWGDKFQPMPPYHIGCRSTTAPVLDKRFRLDDDQATRASKGSEGGKQVSAQTTYYDFLKKQSVEFQNDVLGPTRAKLLRNGGLTSDEFAKLTVDQKFRPLTLDEMKAKNPLAFDNAGIG